MAIGVSVQYNGGSLPETIQFVDPGLLDHQGTHLNAMKRFYICKA